MYIKHWNTCCSPLAWFIYCTAPINTAEAERREGWNGISSLIVLASLLWMCTVCIKYFNIPWRALVSGKSVLRQNREAGNRKGNRNQFWLRIRMGTLSKNTSRYLLGDMTILLKTHFQPLHECTQMHTNRQRERDKIMQIRQTKNLWGVLDYIDE